MYNQNLLQSVYEMITKEEAAIHSLPTVQAADELFYKYLGELEKSIGRKGIMELEEEALTWLTTHTKESFEAGMRYGLSMFQYLTTPQEKTTIEEMEGLGNYPVYSK